MDWFKLRILFFLSLVLGLHSLLAAGPDYGPASNITLEEICGRFTDPNQAIDCLKEFQFGVYQPASLNTCAMINSENRNYAYTIDCLRFAKDKSFYISQVRICRRYFNPAKPKTAEDVMHCLKGLDANADALKNPKQIERISTLSRSLEEALQWMHRDAAAACTDWHGYVMSDRFWHYRYEIIYNWELTNSTNNVGGYYYVRRRYFSFRNVEVECFPVPLKD